MTSFCPLKSERSDFDGQHSIAQTLHRAIMATIVDELREGGVAEDHINGYRTDGGWSIFITGSNSYLLSGELVTKLTGRYLEFEVFTLDFAEYLGMKRMLGKPLNANRDEEFARYLREGDFPKAVSYDGDEEKRAYVRGIVSEIFEKDINYSYVQVAMTMAERSTEERDTRRWREFATTTPSTL